MDIYWMLCGFVSNGIFVVIKAYAELQACFPHYCNLEFEIDVGARRGECVYILDIWAYCKGFFHWDVRVRLIRVDVRNVSWGTVVWHKWGVYCILYWVWGPVVIVWTSVSWVVEMFGVIEVKYHRCGCFVVFVCK